MIDTPQMLLLGWNYNERRDANIFIAVLGVVKYLFHVLKIQRLQKLSFRNIYSADAEHQRL